MSFFDKSEPTPERLCNDATAWGIVKNLTFEDVQKIRYAEVYKHYTQEYVGLNTPSTFFLLIVLSSNDMEIDLNFINVIYRECYNDISEIRFYNPKSFRFVDGDCILRVKRIKQLDGSTRPFVVARPNEPAPAVS